jgi:hypothetical protein
MPDGNDILGGGGVNAQIPLDAGKSQQGPDPLERAAQIIPFAAKMQAGQIIANAPDQQTAIDQLQKNPSIAAFAPDLINNYTQMHNIATQTTGIERGQNQDVLQGLFGQLLPDLRDPKFDPSKSLDAYESAVPKDILARNGGALSSAVDSFRKILQNTPKDQVQNQIVGWALASGMDPGHITPMLATPMLYKAPGGGQQAALQNPSFGPQAGAMTGAGPMLVPGIAPSNVPGPVPGTVLPAQGQPDQALPYAGGPPMSAGGPNDGVGNSLGATLDGVNPATGGMTQTGEPRATAPLNGTTTPPPAPPSRPGPYPGAPPSRPGPYPGAPPVPPSPDENPNYAGDGKPLVSWDGPAETGIYGATQIGGMINPDTGKPLTPAQMTVSENAGKQASEDQQKLTAVQTAKSQLDQMIDLYQTMNKDPEYRTGSIKPLSQEVMKGVNSLWQQFFPGKELPSDPKQVGAGEAFLKISSQLQAQMAKTLTRGQESNHIFDSISSSFPGLENTPLGGLLVSEGTRAIMQRQLDLVNYEQQYADHFGNYYNAEVRFNRDHSLSDYERPILAKYGMGPDGFTSKAQMQWLFKQGLLGSAKNAAALAKAYGVKE